MYTLQNIATHRKLGGFQRGSVKWVGERQLLEPVAPAEVISAALTQEACRCMNTSRSIISRPESPIEMEFGIWHAFPFPSPETFHQHFVFLKIPQMPEKDSPNIPRESIFVREIWWQLCFLNRQKE